MNITYHCKICKQPGIAKCDDDCPPDTIKRLAPLLTCDRCFDIRAEYISSVGNIGTLCVSLERIELLRMDTTEAAMTRNRIRAGLMKETQRYCAAVAKTVKASGNIWDVDFVEQLMEYPAKVGIILQTYRKMLKAAVAQPVTPELTPAERTYKLPYPKD